MADWQILAITAAAILLIVLLIVKFHVNPVVSLVLGGAVLGLATGMGASGTTETLMSGFGDIMMEVGLLIAWGVLMGSILNEMGAIPRLVDTLMGIFGKRGVPYALGVTLGTALQSIFLDVLLVISAPLARKIAPRLGKYGTAKMATSLAIGLECGIVLMVPGVAAVALAGLLSVPLGEMLVFGFLVIVPTIIVSIAIMNFFLSRGLWKPELDEDDQLRAEMGNQHHAQTGKDTPPSTATGAAHTSTEAVQTDTSEDLTDGHGSRVGLVAQQTRDQEKTSNQPSLLLLFTPMLLALALIASGAILEIVGFTTPVMVFLSSPVIALLIGLLGTIVAGRRTIGGQRVEKAIVDGFRESGQILLLTGAGGSLAAVVAEGGLGDILGQYFNANTVAPLLTVWVIAALLHIAVGSVSISAITAAGLLAPVAGQMGMNPVLIALAAGAGSLFLVHVTSNTFWLLQSLLGQTTRGTLKTCSVGVSVASVVALGFTLVLSIFL